LNTIAESEEDFYLRKNKFLDHLIGRFAEQFTDYALLTFKISGELIAPKELVEDKLAFLNTYPLISSARGKGFNHQETCKLWHPDNISGLRRRVSFLTGIDETEADKLKFSPAFEITHFSGGYLVRISDSADLLMKNYIFFKTENEAKLAIE